MFVLNFFIQFVEFWNCFGGLVDCIVDVRQFVIVFFKCLDWNDFDILGIFGDVVSIVCRGSVNDFGDMCVVIGIVQYICLWIDIVWIVWVIILVIVIIGDIKVVDYVLVIDYID